VPIYDAGAYAAYLKRVLKGLVKKVGMHGETAEIFASFFIVFSYRYKEIS